MKKLKDKTEIGSMFGEKIVVRKINGQVVLINRPKRKRNKPSAKELAHRLKFKQAAIYSASIKADEQRLALYSTKVNAKHHSPQSVAIQDFFHPPVVESIDASSYRGRPGEIIEIIATDDFMVVKVTVIIAGSDKKEVERGDAIQDAFRADRWVYKAVNPNKILKGTTITAVAQDLPRNQTIKELKLE